MLYSVKGPVDQCDEINANSLDDALASVQNSHPEKHVAADASETIYVCNTAEELEACQARLRDAH